MSSALDRLLRAGMISPLDRFFARFVADCAGVTDDGLLAHSAALVSHAGRQGHVRLDLAGLAGGPLFEGPPDAATIPYAPLLHEWIEQLQASPAVAAPGGEAPLILDRQWLYLGRAWRNETRVVEAVRERLQPLPTADDRALGEVLGRLFPATPGRESAVDWQMLASAVACQRRFAVISGGPGTGKTTTLVKLLALLLEHQPGLRIRLAAPTGKAAARMVESVRLRASTITSPDAVRQGIPEQAGTLHRLLGFDGEQFRFGRERPLPLDCLVIDEASMIDLSMMARVVDALPRHARLILLGDRDQLASVEAGNVLGDLTGHGRALTFSPAQAAWLERVTGVPTERLPVDPETPLIANAVALLRTSYRFDEQSAIGRLADAINRGDGEQALRLLDDPGNRELRWSPTSADQVEPRLLEWAVEHYSGYLQAEDVADALQRFEQTRVLCALQGGPLGVDTLNRLIESRLGDGGWLDSTGHGQPLMVTVNDYEQGLYNGDTGLLWRDNDGRLWAWFRIGSQELRQVALHNLPPHVTAWAMTVHKSQGSEFQRVGLLLPSDSDSPVLTRELIYTGATRARAELRVQGSEAALITGCRRRVARASGLAERLGWGHVDAGAASGARAVQRD